MRTKGAPPKSALIQKKKGWKSASPERKSTTYETATAQCASRAAWL